MLPEFYIEYLKTYLPSSEFLTLQILVWLLQVHRQVRIERLASSFPYPIKCESRRKKIQRFLTLPRLSLPLLMCPLIKKIISSQFKKGDRLIITIDRTQWKANNISMVSVIWKKRALPIYWLLLSGVRQLFGSLFALIEFPSSSKSHSIIGQFHQFIPRNYW